MHWPAWSWLHNATIWAVASAWLVAQMTKLLNNVQQTHRVDFNYLVKLGGMPSAHSAAVCALATSVGLRAGFDGPMFATSLALAVVVMFDAQTVRRSAGLQARLLNQMVDQFLKERRPPEHKKLAELFGHTRLEVFMGMLMGVLTALLVHALMGC